MLTASAKESHLEVLVPIVLDTNLDYARYLARKLSLEDRVLGVELFGSTARGTNSTASDIDLIVLVPEATYQWCCHTLQIMNSGSAVAKRALMLLLFLGLPASELERMSRGHRLDVFMLPENWRSRLCEIRTSTNNPSPDFFVNIAADARPWNPTLSEFEPLPDDPDRDARQHRIAHAKRFYRSQDA